MNLQFVFGNPSKKAKKKMKKNKKLSHGRKAMAKTKKKKRSGKRKSSKAKRRNPERVTIKVKKVVGVNKKGKKKYAEVHKNSKVVLSSAEMSMLKSKRSLVLAKAKGGNKKLRNKAKAIAKKMADIIAKKQAARDEVTLMVKSAQEIAKASGPEAHVVRRKAKWEGGKSSRKKKSKKKKSTKKKAGKRKSAKRKAKKSSSGSRSVIFKRRGSKIRISSGKGRGQPGLTISKASNPGRRKPKKRRSSGTRSLASGKSFKLKVKKGKKSASFKIKANPLGGIMGKVEQYTGHSVAELGSLAIGGALYGAVNGLTAKYAKPVHSILTKVPVVGNALPTMAIGALLNYLGERQNIKALQTLGKGLVGASVVGMGVNASQMVPGLKAMAGVDFTMEGYGDEADFGLLPEGLGDDADFGGVDYTMDGDGQMGEIPYSGVDYTMEGYGDDADFGGIPEGLGQGQMG